MSPKSPKRRSFVAVLLGCWWCGRGSRRRSLVAVFGGGLLLQKHPEDFR